MSAPAQGRPKRLTQAQRVARAFRRVGPRGITQLDFDAPTIDGRAPIRRVASRVAELRDAGYVIRSDGRRQLMAVYVLVHEPRNGDR
jgi:hypothetical protein